VELPEGLRRWQGHVAIVTGASSGIGWALAQVLVAAGIRVVAAARHKAKLEALQVHLVYLRLSKPIFLVRQKLWVVRSAEIAAAAQSTVGLDAVRSLMSHCSAAAMATSNAHPHSKCVVHNYVQNLHR
jgi:NAD(P)-dependent dehydrogenase (short-subunit alcohol dehydrogenase family)